MWWWQWEIEAAGTKQVLDFETGSSESLETVDRLLGRLVDRGFGPPAGQRLLRLREGSAAIAGATRRRRQAPAAATRQQREMPIFERGCNEGSTICNASATGVQQVEEGAGP